MKTHKDFTLLTPDELEELEERIPEWATPLWLYWEDYVELFLGYGKSTATVENTRQAIVMMLRHTNHITFESLRDTMGLNKMFLKLKQEKEWKESTLNSYQKNLKSYVSFVHQNKKIPENYLTWLQKASEKHKNPPILDTVQVRAVVGTLSAGKHSTKIERLRSLLYVHLAIVTGARPKELLTLNINSFIKGRKEVCINGIKQKGKQRYYPVQPYIQEVLSEYIRELVRLGRDRELQDHLFISLWNRGQPWSYKGLNKLFQRLSMDLWIKVTSYMFRRYTCTELFKKEMPLQEIQMFMWHTRAATTYSYNYNSAKNTTKCSSYISENAFGSGACNLR